MRKQILRTLCAMALLFSLAATAKAQSLKLLAPNVGWMAASRSHLLWTSDGGRDWKDITPPKRKDSVISAIFFLNTNRGWVLLAHGEPDVPGGLRFDLATTDSAGATWSVKPLGIPKWSSRALFNAGAWLAFSDPNHGLLALATGLSPMSAGHGALFATSDGGKSWVSAGGGLAAPMVMVTPQFGWLVGGQANDELYVTRDGAETWRRVVLESPVRTAQMQKYDRKLDQFRQSFGQNLRPELAAHARKWADSQDRTYAAYDLPTFKDPEHGYICVTYPGTVVLFTTSDGGVTWKPDRSVTGLHEHSMDERVVSAVTDSTWITGRALKSRAPQLTKLGPGAQFEDGTMPAPEESGISQMSFVTANQGWVFTVNGRLLSTNDGGATWTDITPGRKAQVPAP